LVIDKPGGPGKVWSIDLAGPFPSDADGMVYAIIAADPFSKWVEIGLLPSKRAYRTADWLNLEIISRWGKPLAIRLDNGTEWKAEFLELSESMDIKLDHISVGNS
jgi:hypothetical protein